MKRSPAISLTCVLAWSLIAAACSRSPQSQAVRAKEKGLALMQKKDYTRAALEFRNLTKLQPRDSDGFYNLGLALLALKDRRGSANAFRRATNVNPKHWASHVELAALLARSSSEADRQEAQTRASQVPAGVPESAAAAEILSYLDWRAGRVEAAQDRLKLTLQSAPSHVQSAIELAEIYLSGKQPELAEQTLLEEAAKVPSSADIHFALGQIRVARGNLNEAASEFQTVLRIDPQFHAALARLAVVHERQAAPAQAELDLRQLAQTTDMKYVTLYARYLLRNGKPEAAVAEYERLAKAYPDERSIREELISADERTGKNKQAEATIDAALKKNPKDTEALFRRSQFLIARGRYREAEQDLDKVLHLRPDSAEVHYVASALYRSLNQPLRQRAELERALDLNPRLLRARTELIRLLAAQGNARIAIDLADATPADQKATAEALVARDWALLAARRFGDLREALKDQQKTPETQYLEGVMSLNNKDYLAARSQAEAVLASASQSIDAWQLLAAASDGMKDRGYAIRKLEAAAAANSKSVDLQSLLGQWKIMYGDNSGARHAYEAALKLRPDLLDAQIRLAELEDMGGNTMAALQRAQLVVSSHPESVRGQVVLAALLTKAGQRSEAAAIYRKVLETDPKNVAALSDLGDLLATSDPQRAFEYAKQAQELAPENPDVLDTLGWIEYKMGRYPEAVKHLELAQRNNSNDARFAYHLALAEFKVGNTQAGDKALKVAQEKDASFSFLRQEPALALQSSHGR